MIQRKINILLISFFSLQFSGLAALANMNQHEEERSLSISPTMNNNSSMHMYNSMQHPSAAQSALHMQQLIAANHLMSSGLPMSLRAQLASSIFQPHPALFNAWQGQHRNITTPSPTPPSPISPVLSTKSSKKLTNNNHIVSTTTNVVQQKKQPVKRNNNHNQIKQQLSNVMTQMHDASRDLITPESISPPTPGSSPQSNGSIDQGSVISTGRDIARDKVFTCKICTRSFGYKHVLQNHERTHTGEKPFECPECHKRFTRDHHLKTHMRLHTGEKPYSCDHCDRKFVQVANLRRHLRVHTGERPYTCEVCDARFSDSNQLKSHVLIHNGEKPFQCDRCHSKFRRRHHLLHHKCSITSPPTSPVMSLSDQKSIGSQSEISDESILHQFLPLPLGLPTAEDPQDLSEKRNRKSRDIRRVIRLPPQILHVPVSIPEQTEPEDLSMHSPRSPASNMSHDDYDLDELDDAASLYMKQRQSNHVIKMES